MARLCGERGSVFVLSAPTARGLQVSMQSISGTSKVAGDFVAICRRPGRCGGVAPPQAGGAGLKSCWRRFRTGLDPSIRAADKPSAKALLLRLHLSAMLGFSRLVGRASQAMLK